MPTGFTTVEEPGRRACGPVLTGDQDRFVCRQYTGTRGSCRRRRAIASGACTPPFRIAWSWQSTHGRAPHRYGPGEKLPWSARGKPISIRCGSFAAASRYGPDATGRRHFTALAVPLTGPVGLRTTRILTS